MYCEMKHNTKVYNKNNGGLYISLDPKIIAQLIIEITLPDIKHAIPFFRVAPKVLSFTMMQTKAENENSYML